MTSRYVAFIVRMRIDEPGSGPAAEHGVHGSLQAVGSETLHYFASFEEALELLKGMARPPAAPLAEQA